MAGMIPVAVVLIVLVIVFTVAIIIGNPQSFDLLVFVARIPANITGVYVTGAVTMLVLAVAGWLLWTGIQRTRAQHKEIRALKAAAGVGTKPVTSGSGKAAPGDRSGGGASTEDDAGRGRTGDRDQEPVGGTGNRGDAGTETDSAAARADAETGLAGEGRGTGGSASAGAAGAVDDPGRDSDGSQGRRDDATPSTDRDHGGRSSTGDRDLPATTAEERRRMLAEADELTGDDNDK